MDTKKDKTDQELMWDFLCDKVCTLPQPEPPESEWYEWDSPEPVLVDIRKLDDEILALILLQAAGERGYNNYFSTEEHTSILGLAWRRDLLEVNENAVDRALSEELGIN